MTDADGEPGSLAARIGRLALAFAIGALYGAAATIGHRSAIRFGEVVISWGVVAALVGVAALLIALRIIGGGRLSAGFAGAGVVAAIALLTLPGPGGSVLIVDDALGIVWSVGAPLVCVLVVAWPRFSPVGSRRPAPSGRRID